MFFTTSPTVTVFDATKGLGFIQSNAAGANAIVAIGVVEQASNRTIAADRKIGYDCPQDYRSGKMTDRNPQAV